MRSIVFDFNGTMVFDAPYHDKAWKQFVKERMHKELEEKELVQYFHGAVNDKIIQRLFPTMNAQERKQLSEEKEAMYRDFCREDKEGYQLVKGLKAFLDKIKQEGIQRNIASASIQENITFFVETFALQQWFVIEDICYDDGTYVNKVKMFQDAASKMQTTLQECIVFEDSLSGITCAKQAGAGMIIAIAPESEQERFQSIEGISFVIEDFNDPRLQELW